MEEDFQEKLKEVKEGQIDLGNEKKVPSSQKSLPTKTKIAAWWMIVELGSSLIVELLYEITGGPGWLRSFARTFYFLFVPRYLPFFPGHFWFLPLSLDFLSGSFLFISFLLPVFFYILKGRKWAWWIGVMSLLVGVGLLIFTLLMRLGGFKNIYYMFILSIPLALFLFDRKNFWKIAT